MSLDDIRIHTVRLPRHGWKYLVSELSDEFWDSLTGQDLILQLQLGVPLHPSVVEEPPDSIEP